MRSAAITFALMIALSAAMIHFFIAPIAADIRDSMNRSAALAILLEEESSNDSA
jgi:hypothetical protein